MTKIKFQPGTFLEVDDFAGTRKVVMVGRDGVTCWDAVDASKVTPLVIHPVMNPVELGPLSSFVQSRGLTPTAGQVVAALHGTHRQDDSLFMMRMLWLLAGKAANTAWAADAASLNWAHQQAELQEAAALRLHGHAQQYRQPATV